MIDYSPGMYALMNHGYNLICLSAEVKYQYRSCTPLWVMCLERGSRALHHNLHVEGTLAPGQEKKSLHLFSVRLFLHLTKFGSLGASSCREGWGFSVILWLDTCLVSLVSQDWLWFRWLSLVFYYSWWFFFGCLKLYSIRLDFHQFRSDRCKPYPGLLRPQ